jgi:hypothetical protein
MLLRSVAVLLLIGCAGCGAHGAASSRSSVPLSARELVLFEDGADLLANPDVLQDRWKADYDRELDERIAASDLVALGVVTNVRSDLDPDGKTNFRLLFSVERTLAGEADSTELSLTSLDGSAGSATIRDNRAKLLQRPMVVFVKYGAGKNGGTTAHFHLALRSKTIETRVDENEAKKRPSTVIVVETKN